MYKLYSLVILCLLLYRVQAQSYPVGVQTITYTDAARSNRSVGIEFHYPGTNAAVANDSFPFVIFAHGFQMDQTPYYPFADTLAQRGYIVGLLTTETGLLPSHPDFAQDLIFAYQKLIAESQANTASPFYHHVVAKGALGGHSMGGGSTVLSCQYSEPAVCYFTMAAATTNPSSITAAPNMTKPYLSFAGSRDCIAPLATHQQPMYDSSNSVCKTLITITDATHCQFGNGNFQCNFGEGFSGCASTPLSRNDQINKTLYFLVPFLDYYLKGNCSAWTLFESRYAADVTDNLQQDCATIVPENPSVMGGNTYCAGGTAALTAFPSGFTYQWSTGATGDSIFVSQDGNYAFTVSNGSCSLTSPALAVQQAFPPATPAGIIGPDTVCANIANIVLSVQADTGVLFYQWSLPSGWAITQGDSTNQVWVTSGNTGGAISVVAENSCGVSQAVQKNMTVTPSTLGTPGSITGDTSICEGTSVQYAIQPVNGASTYVWNFPVGWQGSSTTDSITLIAALSGTIAVQAENECGQSIPANLYVSVNTPPILSGVIIGEDSVCVGHASGLYYSLSNISAADSFQWSIPGDWTWASTNGASSILVNAGASGTISVSAVNGCGSSNALSVNVAVADTPHITLTQTGANLIATGGMNYEWFLNGQPLPGVSGSTYAPTQTGTYVVLGYNAEGCSAFSAAYAYSYNGLAAAGADYLRLFPNPAHAFVCLSLANRFPADIRIADGTGNIVLQLRMTRAEETIPLTRLSKGVYVLTATCAHETFRQKLVIE